MMNSITRSFDIRDCQTGNIAGNGGSIAELPLNPIESNTGTESYYLPKYLAKYLSPLSDQKYKIICPGF